MSNHVHLIIRSKGKPVGSILRDVKRHTSKAIVKAISKNTGESRRDWMLWFFEREGKGNPNNENYQFWRQDENHPIELWSNAVIDQKLDYIHFNPVVTGCVDEPEHYLYSSARDYAGDRGLIDKLILLY